MLRKARRFCRDILRSRFRAGKVIGSQSRRPVLSESGFIASLHRCALLPHPGAGAGTATAAIAESLYDAALACRSRIGSRFFVEPARIESLYRHEYRLHPLWSRGLGESVAKQLDAGLDIYSRQGPPLSSSYPWGALAEGPGADSLYPYRPHRFGFLPRLALAVLQDLASPGALLEILDSWILEAERGDNPYCYGTNLVVLQRVLAVSWAWAFLAARTPLRTDEGLGLEARLLRILWSDACFLRPRIGQSVPNNHLLADHFAAWYLNAVVPEFAEPSDGSEEVRFKEEFLRQTFSDGGSFEHSAHYHEFACEMGCAYLLLCRMQQRSPQPEISNRVRALLFFQAQLTGPEAMPLPFGNAVEDTLFPLDAGEGWCTGSLRELYRALFDSRLEAAPATDASVERAFWLLGGDLAVPAGASVPCPRPTVFEQGGMYVYPDRELGSRLVFRTGPQPGSKLAGGHMHADQLSVYLSVNGQRLMVDSGTYTYRHPSRPWDDTLPWRTYLAGPAGHNGLTIEGHDPLGNLAGDFRPFELAMRVAGTHATGNGIAYAEGSLVDAGIYSGYTRTCIHIVGRYWLLLDRPPAPPEGTAHGWYGFQFAAGLALTAGSPVSRVECSARQICTRLVSSLGVAPDIHQGSFDPVGGWVSPRYGEVLPAPQFRYPLANDGAASAFVIAPVERFAPCAAEVVELTCGGYGIRLATGSGQDVLILGASTAQGVPNEFEGLVFTGGLLWASFESGGLARIRWLNGESLKYQRQAQSIVFTTSTGEMIF